MSEAARTIGNEPGEIRAAALAGLAESGLLYIPASLLLAVPFGHTEVPAGRYVPFVAAFTAAVAISAGFRRSRSLPTAVAVLAVVLGGALAGRWSGPGVAGFALSVIVVLLLGLRVVTLALREWRDPIQASFGWGAVALLAEAVLATSTDSNWGGLLLVVIPQFFLASLGSRAVSVGAAGAPDSGGDVGLGAWGRYALAGVGSVGALFGAALALGGRGGFLEELGRVATVVFSGLASALAFAFAQLARPIFWLVDRLGIDPEGVRRALQRIGRSLQDGASRLPSGDEGTPFQRIVGLLALVGVAALLVWAIRLQRARFRPRDRDDALETEPVSSRLSDPARLPRARRLLRRELPADTVRRWYAEILLTLEQRGLAKAAWQTPGEYLPQVAEAFPPCAPGFASITRAYESVRYGNRPVDRGTLGRLQAERDRVLRAIRETRG